MKKLTNFTQLKQKNTHLSGCKIMHLCTIAIVTVHICTVTIAYAFNILLVFFLSLVSALTLTLTGLSPCLCSHLTSLPPLFPHLLSLSPLLSVKPCLHCRRSNHAFTAADSELHHLFANFLCRCQDSEILVGPTEATWQCDERVLRRSTFAAAAEENQPSKPTEVTRRWTSWWTSASSKLKS